MECLGYTLFSKIPNRVVLGKIVSVTIMRFVSAEQIVPKYLDV